MSHPYAAHRQTAKEHSRVGHITKGYAKGGAVHEDAAEDKKLIKKMMKSEMHAEGGKSKHRADRPGRAKGGKVKGRAKTIVNVITGGHPAGGAVPPMPAPPMGVGPAAMGPPPPMAAKPPMPIGPPPGAGLPPGGAPPMPMRAKGGAVKSIGMDVGTPVQHSDGKSDGKDVGRGRQITFWAGGGVKKKAGGMCERAKGGRVESPDGVAPATKLPGGSGGGEARLAKEHRAERR